MPARAATALDLARLSEQMERDRDSSWFELQQRDNEIGRQCEDSGDQQRLLCWLDALEKATHARAAPPPLLTENAIGLMLAVLSLVLGFLAMVGFLFAHGQGMVNVLWFFAFFVLLQFALCLVSALTLVLVIRGGSPVSISLNPARWLAARSLPGRRYWREFQDVVQLVFLRYGQGMGVGFVLGALLAFLLVLALNDFTFVWSSTFQVSNEVMQTAVDIVSAPWAQWLPMATVDAQVIAESRYYPTAGKFSSEQLRSMHSWWPLLFMSMVTYTLLPRVLLWLLARYLYQRRITATFLGYPGADLVLRRMSQPPIQTRGTGTESTNEDAAMVMPREGVLLVSWSGAISDRELGQYAELQGLGEGDLVVAGLSLAQDQQALERAADGAISLVILVVKSWEPPMADLADFVSDLVRQASCLVFLRPLEGEDIPRERLEDWKRFSAEVPGGVQVKTLNQLAAAQPAAVEVSDGRA